MNKNLTSFGLKTLQIVAENFTHPRHFTSSTL